MVYKTCARQCNALTTTMCASRLAPHRITLQWHRSVACSRAARNSQPRAPALCIAAGASHVARRTSHHRMSRMSKVCGVCLWCVAHRTSRATLLVSPRRPRRLMQSHTSCVAALARLNARPHRSSQARRLGPRAALRTAAWMANAMARSRSRARA